MADLSLTFADLYNRVSSYLGTGSAPTGDNLTLCKEITNRAYRRFIWPVYNDGRSMRRHVWSFMKKPTSITITSTLISGKVTGINLVAGGTGYSVGDVLTLTGGDSGCTAVVRSVTGGVVTTVGQYSEGTGYTANTTYPTTVSPSGGSNCTIRVTSVADDTQAIYDLPDDFGSIDTPFTYVRDDSSLVTTLTNIDERMMLAKLAFKDTQGSPMFFCIREKSPATIAFYEVIFFPVPNGTYTFAYTYNLSPPKLSSAGDVPLTDIENSECLMQMCLAAAELQEDNVASVQERKCRNCYLPLSSPIASG